MKKKRQPLCLRKNICMQNSWKGSFQLLPLGWHTYILAQGSTKYFIYSITFLKFYNMQYNYYLVGEEGVKSHRGKKSQALLTHLLWPNSQDDVIILDTFLRRSSEGKLKLVLQIQGRFSPTLVIFGTSNRYFDFQSFWCSPQQLHCGMIRCSYKVFLMFRFHSENSVFAMWPPWSHDHKSNYKNSSRVKCHTVTFYPNIYPRHIDMTVQS